MKRRSLDILRERGAVVPLPESVEIAPEVDLDRIDAAGLVIHPGCRLRGARTAIGPGARLGQDGPVTLLDCRLDRNVTLEGGSFSGAVFLEGALVGPGAHVRPGTLLEEGSRAGHAVGMKQTVLFPFVTLGSLINFCDVLMAGGTGSGNHSEVGSSYIHFNFTPAQDKATPSLLGDVPRGVMLNQAPIFLGGQGGLVGPVRIGFGTTIAAGVVRRRDFLPGGKLLFGGSRAGGEKDFDPAVMGDILARVRKNLHYLANLFALRRWYLDVRIPRFGADPRTRAALAGAVELLDSAIAERTKRLGELADKCSLSAARIEDRDSPARKGQLSFCSNWGRIRDILAGQASREGDPRARDAFLAEFEGAPVAAGYVAAVQALSPAAAAAGTAWLQGIVETVEIEAAAPLES
ncbi:MAG TPA: UDP-N-acetylglucosamine pyrophosphorylase [bacterium]|nr:UDP-N-acetylglucosamine pyrophosphorylase [bacterium]HPQ65653.1 UDP-N-acetylglucosamine pyrophosphorylase [bacterium]